MLRGAGFEVTVIDRADFGHGRTRNALARRAGGELLIFLSQDALPIGDDFVARMVEPFDDGDVAGWYFFGSVRKCDGDNL